MRRYTVCFSLQITYSVIILIAFFAIAIFYSSIQVPELKRQTSAVLTQNAASITASMDNELNQMSTVALNISYSTLVKDRFFYIDSSSINEYSESYEAKALLNLLTALIFPNRPVDQINLYSKNNYVVSSGLRNIIYQDYAHKQPWYSNVMRAPNHQSFQFLGKDDELSKYFTGPYGKHFVSFTMQIYDNFNNPYGFIEIRQRLNRIISAALNYSSVYGEKVYIYDGNGLLLFPLGEESNTSLFQYAKNKNFPNHMIEFPFSKDKELFICAPSQYSDFCTIIVISEHKLLQQVRKFISNIALVTVIALIFALVLAYFAAQRLTKPIEQICRQISSIDISRPSPLPPLNTKLIELNTLHSAFSQMQAKLAESVNKQLMLQSQEMQSRLLALQSQMNPHFLYNSLATIQAMADEGMNEEITIMCQSMSNILRYISSKEGPQVTLAAELSCTEDFLRCMVIRHQGDLSYTIDVPDEMLSIKVPKLCIQLLVENAIKFASTRRPPYLVSISGRSDQTCYEITIKDNGPGFSPEILSMLHKKIEEINKTGLLPSLEINGMGILNVYIRYRLLLGNRLIFRLENNKEGGACVTIGEKYNE